MRKFIKYISIVSLLTFVGCVDTPAPEYFKPTTELHNIETEEHSLNYPQAGGAYKVKISSDYVWNIYIDEANDSWVDVTPSTGDAGEAVITIAVTPNWSIEQRTGYIRMYAGDFYIDSIAIKQEAVSLSADTDKLSFKALGESKTMTIESNIEWEIVSRPSWISIAPTTSEGATTITVTAENNSDSVNRAGKVVLGKEGFSHNVEVEVIQDGKYFTLNDEDMVFRSTGGVKELSLSTNDSWSINTVYGADWLSFSALSGNESLVLDVTAADNPSINPRNDVATITPQDGEPVGVVIRQDARYLTVNTYGVQFFSKGGQSSNIKVSTDGEYEITEQVDWLSIIQQGGDKFAIIADVNDTGHIRTGYVTITMTDLIEGSLSLELEVIQITPAGIFGRDDYESEDLWDAGYDSIFNVSVIGYVSDSNWDENGNHGINLNIDGYTGDECWDGTSGSGDMNRDDYLEDENNDANDGSGNIGKDDYDGDENYDNDKVEEEI